MERCAGILVLEYSMGYCRRVLVPADTGGLVDVGAVHISAGLLMPELRY